jgi:regulator of sigma E protease
MVIFAFSMAQLGWIGIAVLGILIGFGALVFVHELGHFIVAKLVGIKVEAFALGFGPKIIGRKRGDTEYRINWIPFGGYVKLAGMEGEEGKKAQEIEGGFYAVKPFRRSLAIAAGAIFNFLFALLIFTILWFTGKSVPEDVYTTTIGSFKEGSSAANSDLKIGDKILAIDGKGVREWNDVIKAVAFANKDTFILKVLRDDSEMDITVKSKLDEEVGAYQIGIERSVKLIVGAVMQGSAAEKMGMKAGDEIESVAGEPIHNLDEFKVKLKKHINTQTEISIKREKEQVALSVIVPEPQTGQEFPILGFAPDIKLIKVYDSPLTSIKDTAEMIYLTLKRLLAFGSAYRIKSSALAGPVGIMSFIRSSMLVSFSFYVWFIAFLSLNLCIVNLLPIPVMDGGHIMFAAIEGARKKPLNEKVMATITNVFVVLIIAFFLYVTMNDFLRITGLKSKKKEKDSSKNIEKIEDSGQKKESIVAPETSPAK